MKIKLLVVVLGGLTCNAQAYAPVSLGALKSLLEHPKRLAQDKVNDEKRKPAQVMRFSGVAKGHAVLDIYAGGGWYSELFARAVGKQGHVYAHNDSLTWRFGKKEMMHRTSKQDLSNITRFDEVLISQIPLEAQSIDIAFMAINYHDLFFTHRIRNGIQQQMRDGIVDYQQAFSHVKKLLKPDGVLIIIDHDARPGSGYQAANDLHRIDANIVKYQLRTLGFSLLEEAFYLKNSNDDLDKSVFAKGIRWNTSRFILKFGKSQTSNTLDELI